MKQVGIPLILTFKLESQSQDRLDAWRKMFFPPERNRLPAHLTIYHQLPGQSIKEITNVLESFVEEEKPLNFQFERLVTRAGFVGIAVESPELNAMREHLSLLLGHILRAQDKQPYRPHVTITNLGSPKDARKCYEALEKIFIPWQGQTIGLELYHYRGGPWEFAQEFPFTHKR